MSRKLLYEYRVVKVDVGRFDRNLDLVERYGAPLKEQGLPFLTVLDAAGEVLAQQETGALEQGQEHDPRKVLSFLEQHQAEPRKAQALLDGALARAAEEEKRVFVAFEAPW